MGIGRILKSKTRFNSAKWPVLSAFLNYLISPKDYSDPHASEYRVEQIAGDALKLRIWASSRPELPANWDTLIIAGMSSIIWTTLIIFEIYFLIK